jgi:hypothetical protein
MDRRYSLHMKAEMDVGTNRKAFQINLDHQKYGTFAEIGAGQEVARRFFHVGGAAGTIAKTISAYDMTFSDAIYGPADRYVSRVRLNTMLDHEYDLLLERLDATNRMAGWGFVSNRCRAVNQARSSFTCACSTNRTLTSRKRSVWSG